MTSAFAATARQLAVHAHGTQQWGTHPYAVHLDTVADGALALLASLVADGTLTADAAAQISPDDLASVSYLHDSVEDTDLTLQALRAHGANDRVVGAVGLLTHEPGMPREVYLARLLASGDVLALITKLADTLHNGGGLAELALTQPERAERLRSKYSGQEQRLRQALREWTPAPR